MNNPMPVTYFPKEQISTNCRKPDCKKAGAYLNKTIVSPPAWGGMIPLEHHIYCPYCQRRSYQHVKVSAQAWEAMKLSYNDPANAAVSA